MSVQRGIVSASWLKANRTHRDVVVIDVRWSMEPPSGRERYGAGHIEGARYLDLDTQLSSPVGQGPGRHPLTDDEHEHCEGDLGDGAQAGQGSVTDESDAGGSQHGSHDQKRHQLGEMATSEEATRQVGQPRQDGKGGQGGVHDDGPQAGPTEVLRSLSPARSWDPGARRSCSHPL